MLNLYQGWIQVQLIDNFDEIAGFARRVRCRRMRGVRSGGSRVRLWNPVR